MRATVRSWPPGAAQRATVTVCINDRDEKFAPCCGRHGGPEILAAIRAGLVQRRLDVDLQTIQCLGLCANGPNLRVSPSGSLYQHMSTGDVPAFLDSLEREIGEAEPAAQGETR